MEKIQEERKPQRQAKMISSSNVVIEVQKDDVCSNAKIDTKNVIGKQERQCVVSDKKERMEELSKLCLEIEKAKEDIRKEKREKTQHKKKKKKKIKETNGDAFVECDKHATDIIESREITPVLQSPTRKSTEEKEKHADKKERMEELSKLCLEIEKAKEDIRKEKREKTQHKKKKKEKIKETNSDAFVECDKHATDIIESREITPVLQSPTRKSKEEKEKHANQIDDDAICRRNSKKKKKKKKYIKIDDFDNGENKRCSTKKGPESNSDPANSTASLDLADSQKSISSINKVPIKSKTTKNTPSTQSDNTLSLSDRKTIGMLPFLCNIIPNEDKPKKEKILYTNTVTTRDNDYNSPLSKVDTLQRNKQSDSDGPNSVQSKRNLFENYFDLNKVEGPLPPFSTPATPKTLKRGFVALNIASPSNSKSSSSKNRKPPKQRILDSSQHDKGRTQGYVDSAISLLEDKSRGNEVRTLVHKIDKAGGFPMTRRLSLRDNELVGRMVMAIRNDPRIKSIEVSPESFTTISSTLLDQFIGSLRINLHLKSLTFSGVELGNDFLYSLASSMESNFVIEEIDLSENLFTNAGLAEFCQIFASSNDTCHTLNLENQTTPISNASEVDVLDAFRHNKSLNDVRLDFQSEKATQQLYDILDQNRQNPPPKMDNDEKLINVLLYEAERAQELWDDKNEEDSILDVSETDWGHLYELSVQFDKHKLKKHIQDASEDFVPSTQRRNGDSMTKEEKKEFLFGDFQKNLGESISCFNSNGSFLTAEFISKYFEEDTEGKVLTFDFHGQWKLFKRFLVHDPARELIVTKFIEAIVTHPRADKITGINMANTGCGDDFLVALANRCLGNEALLPSLFMLNFETNFINVDGITALAELIKSPTSLKFLQVIRLENQKFLLKSKAEFALARAMRVNFSIVVMSLRIRNLMERQQINKYVLRNVEFIRQSRQRHFKATGQQRERNQVEKFFESIAKNDEAVDEVDLVGNNRFLTLTREEKTKAAESFATNTHVKIVKLNSCGIDDDFAITLAGSLKRNKSIKRIFLDGNAISGVGITALFKALAENSSIDEMRLHKQSKTMNTSEEHLLAGILQPNTTITKLGLDLRTHASVQLDRKLGLNRNLSLKLRAESKGTVFEASEGFSALKF